MQISGIGSNIYIHFEEIPDDVVTHIFSYVVDLASYRALRLTDRRCSTLSLEGRMKHLFTFSNFIQMLKKAPTPSMDKFVEYKIDFSQNDQEAIRVASQKGFTQIVIQLLQDRVVNPAVKCQMPLSLACQEGHVEVVKVLLKDERVTLAATKGIPLCLASQNGHSSVVDILLDHDSSHSLLPHKKTASLMAQTNGHLDIAKRLQGDRNP